MTEQEPFNIDQQVAQVHEGQSALLPVHIGGRDVTFPAMRTWPFRIQEMIFEGDLIPALDEVSKLPDSPLTPEDVDHISGLSGDHVVALMAYLEQKSGVDPEVFRKSRQRSGSGRRR